MHVLDSKLPYPSANDVRLKFQQLEILFVLQQTYPSRIKKRHDMPACPSEHSPATHFPKHTTPPELAQFGNLLHARTHHNQQPPVTLGLKLSDNPTDTQELLSRTRKQLHRKARQSNPSTTTPRHTFLQHEDATITSVPITSSTQNLSSRYSARLPPIRPGHRSPRIELGIFTASLPRSHGYRLCPRCSSTVHRKSSPSVSLYVFFFAVSFFSFSFFPVYVFFFFFFFFLFFLLYFLFFIF
jgi:hypothetical protein